MSEQGDFSELPLDRETQRVIGAWIPALEAFAYALQAGYLSNDPGCETYAWRQVRAARNNIFAALAWLQEAVGEVGKPDQPKNLPTLAGG